MKVLVLIPGPLGERLSAPEVRGWNIALEISSRHDVVVAAPDAAASERQGIPLIGADRSSVVKAARDVDAIVAPRVPPYLYGALASAPTLLIADVYNPAEVEQADLGAGSVAMRLKLKTIRAHDTLQLGFADAVLCAVDSQRRQYARRIAHLARDGRSEPLLRVVPFGIDNTPPPPSNRRPIRERFPAIAADDSIVLWWGNVWRWFDAETAIHAFVRLQAESPKAKLVFTGGRPPRSEASTMDRTEEARDLAASLGVLGSSVFFVDEWVPHEERHHYLQEADVGLTLHRDTPEKEVAARGRYMDYLWTRLPCVLGAGDELADRFAAAGFARTVAPGDADSAAAAMSRLINDPAARSAAKAAADDLIGAFRWSAAVSPVLEALDGLRGQTTVRSQSRLRLYAALASYYGWRLAAEASGTAPS